MTQNVLKMILKRLDRSVVKVTGWTRIAIGTTPGQQLVVNLEIGFDAAKKKGEKNLQFLQALIRGFQRVPHLFLFFITKCGYY